MDHHYPLYAYPQKQIVYHYHYHHFVDEPKKVSNLNRAKSDSNLRNSNFNTPDNQTTSSRQSWKNLIIPAFQSNDMETSSAIKNKSPTSRASETARGRQSERVAQLGLTERKDYLSPKVTKRQRLNTTTQTAANNQQSSIGIQQPSFGTFTENQFSKINPESLEKSSFSKKYQLSSTGDLLKSELVLPESSIMEDRRNNDYAVGLLEEECKYLRRKFLKHYIKSHLLNEEKEKGQKEGKKEKEKEKGEP